MLAGPIRIAPLQRCNYNLVKALRFIAAVVFVVICVTSASFASIMTAAPGKPEPQRLRWRSSKIKLAISNSLIQPNSNIKSDSDVMLAVRQSLRAWQDVADIVFVLETSDKLSLSPTGVFGDGVSLITIAQTPENVLLFSKDPLAESAKTRVFYNQKGFITEADIVLNPFQQFSTDGTFGTFDLKSTLTHEIGHLLGLRHSGVVGATMSESLPKNGSFGNSDLASRALSESDIAAVRELYGGGDSEECCAAITGKLSFESRRTVRELRIWAEDNRTGRVIAQDNTGSDGSFVLGGMPAGIYSVFWQKRDALTPALVGELGIIKVEKGETRTLNSRVLLRASDLTLSYIGVNSQLSDSAITLNAGREYVVYLGGKGYDARNINLEFNSPFFTVDRKSIINQDFGEGLSVISFVVNVSENAAQGEYSIFATGENGLKGSLIGSLKVR